MNAVNPLRRLLRVAESFEIKQPAISWDHRESIFVKGKKMSIKIFCVESGVYNTKSMVRNR